MITKIIMVGTGVILLLTSPIGAQSPSTVMSSGASTGSLTTTGAFNSLSPGDRKIANALFTAQTATGSARLTQDQIATLKGNAGWGQVFAQMKADGVLQARNLGQVVSHSEHQIHTSAPSPMGQSSRTVVITNGLGHTTTFTPIRSASVAAARSGHVPTFVPAHSGFTAAAGVGQGVAVPPASTASSVTSGNGFSHGGGAAHGR